VRNVAPDDSPIAADAFTSSMVARSESLRHMNRERAGGTIDR